MSQRNYLNEVNSPNIVLSCLEDNDESLRSNETNYENAYPVSIALTSQDGTSCNTEQKNPGPQILNTEYPCGCQIDTFETFTYENCDCNLAFLNQPRPYNITACHNLNSNYQDMHSTVISSQSDVYSYGPPPQYIDPYFPSNQPIFQEQHLQHCTHVDRNTARTRSSYNEIVDLFVKSNLESLRKVNYKVKHIACEKEVETKTQRYAISPKQKVSLKQKASPKQKVSLKQKVSPKQRVSPKENLIPTKSTQHKKVVPIKNMLSPKNQILSDIQSSKFNIKKSSVPVPKIVEKSPDWSSKYLKSIGQNQPTINNVNSRMKMYKETKLSADLNIEKVPVVKAPDNRNKDRYQDTIDTQRETVNKSLHNVKNDTKNIKSKSIKKEQGSLPDQNKERIKKTVVPFKHKTNKLNSKIEKSATGLKIHEKRVNVEKKDKIVFDNVKKNVLNKNNALLDKVNSKCLSNENTKIGQVIKSPNSLKRSIVKESLDQRQKNKPNNDKTDLRTVLDGKKILRKHHQLINEAQKKKKIKAIKKANEMKSNTRKPINKIKLVINIVHADKKQLSDSDKSSSQYDSHEDVSFLDDIDVNALLDCLNDSNNKIDCTVSKDNTNQVDHFNNFEKDNLGSFEKHLKHTESNENFSQECAVEKQLADIFSERSKLTTPKQSYVENVNSLKRKIDLENYNSNCNEPKQSKHALVNYEFDSVNDANVDKDIFAGGFNQFDNIKLNSGLQSFFQNPYDSTILKIESMIAQIHGEEVSTPKELEKHEPPAQFGFIDLTIEPESMEHTKINANGSNQASEENKTITKNVMLCKDKLHCDSISSEIVGPIENTQHTNSVSKCHQTSETCALLKTTEIINIEKSKEKSNDQHNIKPEQESEAVANVKNMKLKDISLKTCSQDDQNKHKKNIQLDCNTEQLKGDNPNLSNESAKANITNEITKVDTEDVKTVNKSITDKNKIKTYFTHAYDRVLVTEVENRMLSYLQEEYILISKIHEGSFSSIYKCINSEQKFFAVKVLKSVNRRTKFGIDREAMMFKYQNDVPKENLNCVYLVHSFSLSNSRWGFLMEYYPRNVQQYLQDTGTFHIDVIQQLARQLVGAVIMLRHYNVVHSDIRPNHILINDAGDKIKLCGFDRSYYTKPAVVLPNIGTASYRAPEIILGYSASYSIDVWSIAVVLYELATSCQLFPGRYNNDILFKHMCFCGGMPRQMILNSLYAWKHFDKLIFMRQVGVCGEKRVPVRHFRNDENLGIRLYNAYAKDWLSTRNDSQVNKDAAKLQMLQRLMEQMLRLNPAQRLTAEFVFASPFLFQK